MQQHPTINMRLESLGPFCDNQQHALWYARAQARPFGAAEAMRFVLEESAGAMHIVHMRYQSMCGVAGWSAACGAWRRACAQRTSSTAARSTRCCWSCSPTRALARCLWVDACRVCARSCCTTKRWQRAGFPVSCPVQAKAQRPERGWYSRQGIHSCGCGNDRGSC